MLFFFFFNDTATTEIYTLSLHDALPICVHGPAMPHPPARAVARAWQVRSEEHTSELQSHSDLVCRLLLEKKKNAGDMRSVPLKRDTRDQSIDLTCDHATQMPRCVSSFE